MATPSRRTWSDSRVAGSVARLESAGYIEALAGDARRRPYRLTSAGARALKEDVGALRRLATTATKRLSA
jgi:DNA-binding MarR family transcriptional regulator